MSANKPAFVIGIAGASGSGKTTLSAKILEVIGAENIAILPHDAYYRNQTEKTLEERMKVNNDKPTSQETELIIEHLREFRFMIL